MTKEELQHAIRLAGTIYIKSRLLIESRPKDMSDRARKLEKALDEYDDFIMSKVE